jgi:probable phosphoglycerate mutase
MTRLAFLRHGRTDWNAEGRLTGRADIPLSAAGRCEIAHRRLPEQFASAVWHVSPLQRARETATLLGQAASRLEPRLIEMDFGRFEGERLQELRARLGGEMQANEDRGLDFQPPGGESPRMVQKRLRPFLQEVAEAGGLHVAVCHKSVIRCAMALAYDWPMIGRAPVKLRWECLHVFSVDGDGGLHPVCMNMPLLEAGESR